MIKEAHDYYNSIGMTKMADLSKYLPAALAGTALAGSLYGGYRLANPPTMWDKVKDTAKEVGHSVKDFGFDVGQMALQNPQLLRGLINPNMLGFDPNMQQTIPQQMPEYTPHDRMNIPMGDILAGSPGAQPTDPTMPNLSQLNYQQLQELQNRAMGFSPYR